MRSLVAQPVSSALLHTKDITCHFNEIPAFVEVEIERLYSTLHASLPYFRTFRTLDDVSTYVAWQNSRPAVILLFQVKGRTVHVLNEMIELAQAEVERFATYMFDKLPQVHILSFAAIRTTLDRFAYPAQKHNAKETYVINLPATPAEYLASLSKTLRKNISYELRRIARDYPTFSSQFYEKDQIPDHVLRDLIHLSENRISQKVSDFTHDEKRIMALAKQCGFVNALLIDGKVCAGTVSYHIGTSSFLELIARDPAYKSYGVGMLTNYLTICENIVRGKEKFFLGGGRFDYKEKLLGVLTDADHVEIYRSQGVMLLRLGNAAKTLAQAYVRLAKVWVHTNKEHALSKLATRAFQFYKQQKSGSQQTRK